MYYKYRLQKKQVSTNNGHTWTDVSPLETQLGDIVGAYNTFADCASGSSSMLLRWVAVSGETMCSGTTKCQKEKLQVSNDSGATWTDVSPEEYKAGQPIEYYSVDCGYIPQYRWVPVSGQFMCSGTTKCQKEKKQVSNDSGTTWVDVSPVEYKAGQPIEYYSVDCSYIPPSEYTQYLTTVARESGSFLFYCNNNAAPEITSVSYSLDSGSTWMTTSITGETRIQTPSVNSGQKVYWKGIANGYCDTGYNAGYSRISGSSNFDIEGNIMSLLYDDNFISATTIVNNKTFSSLFAHNSKLISIEHLVLPATTLTDSCYSSMFENCPNLTTAPELPATTLGRMCYRGMFSGCTSLDVVPVLPATILAEYCYYDMFAGCTSLTTAPVLAAATLVTYCYFHMFRGCSSLNSITCLATDISATNCTQYWVDGVAASGTFVKASSMSSWGTGNSGIPNGWTIQNA